jgi:exosortase A
MNDLSGGPVTKEPNTSIGRVVALAVLYSVVLLAVFHDTARSIVSIWLRSETFAHGLLIVPIALYLIWNKRSEVASVMDATVNSKILLLMVPLGFAWLLADLVHVLVVQQLAMVAILIVGLWYILGDKVTGLLVFPLGFLFLGVPMGEGLIAPMMELTAASTVKLVQLSGIPVYRDGMYFSLPSGNWSVVEACSGVRYLIASFTLGVLYAYMTYTSSARRILFVVASIIVPIFANLIRAYLIVMLGHWSDMTIATGVDHLVYGWVFFGFVMFLLFWIGSAWREQEVDQTREISRPIQPGDSSMSFGRPVMRTGLVIAFASFWPALAAVISMSPSHPIEKFSTVVSPAGHWTSLDRPRWSWRPTSVSQDAELSSFYSSENSVVALSMEYFYPQKDSVEVIGNASLLIGESKNWRLHALRKFSVDWDGDQIDVDQISVFGQADGLVLWVWYRVGDTYTSNPYRAKLLEVREKFFGSGKGTARIVLSTSSETDSSAQLVLQDFVDVHFQNIERSLDEVMEPSQK